MSVVRRFLVAPSLVRLIRKERGGARISEGYFPPQAGRTSYVRVEGQHCHLVLVTAEAGGGSSEERTDVPRAHGDALMDVCSGKAAYDRTVVALGGGHEALVDRYVAPGALDLVSLEFEEASGAEAFAPLPWFGPDVSGDPAYDRHAVALHGPPQAGEVGLSNAALEAVLDLVEPRFGLGRYGNAGRPAEDGPMRPPRRGAAAVLPLPPAPPEPPAVEPAHHAEAEAPAGPHPGAQPAAEDAPQADARIDDVIESLSQALGAAPRAPAPPAGEEDVAAEFERWTVRPRRTQQT